MDPISQGARVAPHFGGRPGFIAGLGYPLRGARFVYVDHPSLAKYWVPPILLTSVALLLVLWLALAYRGEVLAAVWPMPSGDGLFDRIAQWLYTFVEWLLALLMVVLGGLVVALSTGVLAAPFNDALSEAVEQLETGRRAAPPGLAKSLRDLRRTVGLELAKLGLYLAIMVPLFVASFALPGVGPLVYAVSGFFLTALFFAVDYVDWPASRREIPVRDRALAALRGLRPMLGLGVGVWVFMYVPLLNLLFMPAAVAGGTLLFLDLNPQVQDINGVSPPDAAQAGAEGQ